MATLSILVATYGGSVASAILPFLNAEILAVSVAAAAPPQLTVPVALVVAAGQMTGKLVMYYGGRGAHQAWRGLESQRLQRTRERLERGGGPANLLLLASATTGLPPFYLVTVGWGSLGLSVSRFLVLGSLGQIIRFVSLALAPGVLRAGFVS